MFLCLLVISSCLRLGKQIHQLDVKVDKYLYRKNTYHLIFGIACTLIAAHIHAQEPVYNLNIPAQSVEKALDQLAEQTGSIALYRFELVEEEQSRAVIGRYTLPEALKLLFSDTELVGLLSESRLISVRPSDESDLINEKVNLPQLSGGGNQTSDDEVLLDEIVVTGIRSSLRQSRQHKFAAASVLDVVTGEDVGKFPDRNVADSLSRITGVAIDRSGGEGQFVTIRGMGPEFNNVLLNGRTQATVNQGREFSFDVFSSGIIRQASVFKTATPALQEGGIGGTVNIVTPKALNYERPRFSWSAASVNDSLAGEKSPELLGVFSQTNSDKTLGLLLGVSYSDRASQSDEVSLDGFTLGPQNVIFGTAHSANLTPADFGVLDDIHVPENMNFRRRSENRERLTGNLGVEFRPSDTLLIGADLVYSKFDVKISDNSFGGFFGEPFIGVEIDSNRTVTGFNRPGQDFLDANPVLNNGGFVTLSQNDSVVQTLNRFTESYQVGTNLQWDVTNRFSLALDFAVSKAVSESVNPFVVIGSQAVTAPRFDLNIGQDIPSFDNLGDFTDFDAQRAHFARIVGQSIEDDIFESRIDAGYEFEREQGLTKVSFGGMYSIRKKDEQNSGTGSEAFCAYCGYTLPIPGSMLQSFSLDNFLNDASGGVGPRSFFAFDPFEVLTFLQRPENLRSPLRRPSSANMTLSELEAAALALESLDGGVYFNRPRLGQSTLVEEGVTAFYADTHWQGEFAGMPWGLDIGLRIAHTNLTSSGFTEEIVDLFEQIGDNNLQIVLADPEPISVSNDYTNILPSANLRLEIADAKVLRFAVSKTVTRPTLTSLGTNTNFGTPRINSAQSSGGNPELEPFESTNFDASFEWYFSEVGFLGAALFHKEFKNFLENATSPIATTYQDQFGERQPLVFQDTRTRNGEMGSVSGLELASVHMFDNLPEILSGLGASINYTYVRSGVSRSHGSSAAECDYNGLSPHSFNVSGFYEKQRLQARLAYNWRDEFLIGCFQQQGRPESREAFGQFDLTIAFALTDRLSLFVEAINILDEDSRDFSVFKERFIAYEDTGSRWSIGIRGAVN